MSSYPSARLRTERAPGVTGLTGRQPEPDPSAGDRACLACYAPAAAVPPSDSCWRCGCKSWWCRRPEPGVAVARCERLPGPEPARSRAVGMTFILIPEMLAGESAGGEL